MTRKRTGAPEDARSARRRVVAQPSSALGADEPSPEAVREQLRRILASSSFEASERRRRFLEFVVGETLAGRSDRLKGYSIAVAVFGRDDSFDPQSDPVVRLEARRLRRDLEHYYLTAGHDDPLRIEIPKGGYAPAFERHGSRAGLPAPAPGLARAPADTPAWNPRRTLLWAGAIGLAVIVLAALGGGARILLDAVEPSSVPDRPAFTAEHEPALAVVPFENLSGGAAGQVLADGITEQLISNLLLFPDFRVFSREASFSEAFRGDPADIRSRVQVDYLVKGSVRRDDARLRVTARLIDARTGEFLWSQTYDRDLTAASAIAIEEDLAGGIASNLAAPYGAVSAAVLKGLGDRAPQTLSAYECVLKAFAYRRIGDPKRWPEQFSCLEQAVRDEPGYADAWAMLALVRLDQYRWGDDAGGDPAKVALRALADAQHAAELAPNNVLALQAVSAVQFHLGRFDEAERAMRDAVAINPYNPETTALLGIRISLRGGWQEGIGYLDRSIERMAAAPAWVHLVKGMGLYVLGNYRAALPEAQIGRTCCAGFGPALLAAVEGQLGEAATARAALQEAIGRSPLLERDPRAFYALFQVDDKAVDLFISGLEKAGLSVPAARAATAAPGSGQGL